MTQSRSKQEEIAIKDLIARVVETFSKVDSEYQNFVKLEGLLGKNLSSFRDLTKQLFNLITTKRNVLMEHYDNQSQKIALMSLLITSVSTGIAGLGDAAKLMVDYNNQKNVDPSSCDALINRLTTAYKIILVNENNSSKLPLKAVSDVHVEELSKQLKIIQDLVKNNQTQINKVEAAKQLVNKEVTCLTEIVDELKGEFSSLAHEEADTNIKDSNAVKEAIKTKSGIQAALKPLVIMKVDLEKKQKIVPPAPGISASVPAPNQAAQIHPAPLSSSHGAKNAASQQKAEAAAAPKKATYVRASKPLDSK